MKKIIFLFFLLMPFSSFADEMDDLLDSLYENEEENITEYLDNNYYQNGDLKENIRDNMKFKAGVTAIQNLPDETQEEVLKSLKDTLYILENIDNSGVYYNTD